MNINTVAQILVMIAPSLSAIATIIGGIVWFAKNAKKNTTKSVDAIKDRQSQEAKDIAIIKSKIASIEKHLIDKKEK